MTQSSSFTGVVGASGTGKTTLVKHLTSNEPKRKTYIINSEKEYREEERNEEISWEQASDRNLENCNLIFEDLIGVRSKETKLIKKFVHFLLRRKNIHLFLVAHEIHNTGLFSLIPCMDFLYVTSGYKNDKVLKDLERVASFEPPCPEDFASLKHHYLKIDLKKKSCTVLNSNFERAQEAEKTDLRSKRNEVLKIVSCLPEGKILMQLFDIIFKNVPASLLAKDTLCLTLESKPGEDSEEKIHIVDYLAALRSPEKPKKGIKKVKKFLDKKVVIPNMLIKNPFLLRKDS